MNKEGKMKNEIEANSSKWMVLLCIVIAESSLLNDISGKVHESVELITFIESVRSL